MAAASLRSDRESASGATLTIVIHGILLALHGFLVVWAIAGLVEFVAPSVPWPRVANPLFPPWVLLLHWVAVLFGGAAFLFGYLARWGRTPLVLAAAYALMAAVCAIETFGYLQHPGRFRDMGLEYGAYLLLVILLFRLPSLQARFRAARAFAQPGSIS